MKQETPAGKAPATLPPDGSNGFEVMLRKHRKGLAAHEASAALSEAINAARITGKVAAVTVVVKIMPQNDNQVVVDIQCATKLPKAKTAPGIFWVDENNLLHDRNPDQGELNLRSVDDENPDVPIREVVPARSVNG